MTMSVPQWSQFGSGSACCWYGRVRMCYSDGQGPPPPVLVDVVGLGHGRRAAPALAVRVGAVGLGGRNSMEGVGESAAAAAAGNGAAVSYAEEETMKKKKLHDSGGHLVMSTVGMSTNIVWHECAVGKLERQKLIGQKGCVIWITGLSGSGKSTLACALSRELHSRGFLTYVLDGDNVRHGLNRDLSFKQEDRAENIRRIGEVAKLFADAGVICIASLISPYRRDREACRAILPDGAFIEVFMDIPLEICETRDPKGLYKLARAGKIKGFTGIDDPYEPPLNCEIKLQHRGSLIPSPTAMADQVVSYLDSNGFLEG